MRSMALLLLVASCGGSGTRSIDAHPMTADAPPTSDARAESDGGAALDAAAPPDAPPATIDAATMSTIDAAPPGSCAALQADYEMKLAAAKSCSLVTMMGCKDVVEGLCCPTVVDSMSSAETMAYLDALHTYEAMCSYACPLTPCFLPATMHCIASGPSLTTGTCSDMP